MEVFKEDLKLRPNPFLIAKRNKKFPSTHNFSFFEALWQDD